MSTHSKPICPQNTHAHTNVHTNVHTNQHPFREVVQNKYMLKSVYISM